jgi:hypothetical protein
MMGGEMADASEQAPEEQAGAQRLRAQIRKLVLMKETGPKSAAWHRARVGTIWRLHRQLDQPEQPPRNLHHHETE